MASPLPQVQVLVGFNNNPMDDHSAWTVASPGVLGAAGVWTDISAYNAGIEFGRHRQHELGVFQAGTCRIRLKNDLDGSTPNRFTPWNTSGPYYNSGNGLVPMKKVQIRYIWNSVTYYKYTGFATVWRVYWPDAVSQAAEVECVDAFRAFNLSLLVSSAYRAQVIADGATAYYELNDAGGSTTIADSVGGHTGTLTNQGGQNPVFGQPGAIQLSSGTAVSLGSLDTAGKGPYFDITGAGFAGAGAWSVECWFKTAGGGVATNGATAILAGQNAVSGATNLWQLKMHAAGTVAIYLYNNAGGFVGPETAAGYADNLWHHAAVTYDGTNLLLYIDGVQRASGVLTGVALVLSARTAIGCDTVPGGAPGNVIIDEVAMYSGITLTPAKVLNHFNLGIGYQQQATGARINSALTALGWPAALTNVDTGVQQCQANAQNLAQTTALQHMQTVERTEEGAVFMDGSGKVRFISRQNLATSATYAQVQARFGDYVDTANTMPWGDTNAWGVKVWGAGSIPFSWGQDLTLDEIDIVNQAVITRAGGLTQTTTDTASRDANGLRSRSFSNLLHLTDAASAQHATWIVNKLKAPATRLRYIDIDMLAMLSNTSQVATVLALDLLYRIAVERTQVSFIQTALIEGIEERIDANSWTIRLSLSATDTYGGWSWNNTQ